jgi:hypothetical protein
MTSGRRRWSAHLRTGSGPMVGGIGLDGNSTDSHQRNHPNGNNGVLSQAQDFSSYFSKHVRHLHGQNHDPKFC